MSLLIYKVNELKGPENMKHDHIISIRNIMRVAVLFNELRNRKVLWKLKVDVDDFLSTGGKMTKETNRKHKNMKVSERWNDIQKIVIRQFYINSKKTQEYYEN